MNKQELIKKYEEIYKVHSPFNETVCYAMMVYSFVEELKKLDEPQEVKVPKFVADWIKHCRGLGYSLYQSMELVHENAEIKKWFIFVDNQDLFARAWLDGYEVEKEKRYIVSLKNGQPLVKSQSGNTLYFNQNITAGNYKVTRKELEEADLDWVFDCPGIEVEEVEE